MSETVPGTAEAQEVAAELSTAEIEELLLNSDLPDSTDGGGFTVGPAEEVIDHRLMPAVSPEEEAAAVRAEDADDVDFAQAEAVQVPEDLADPTDADPDADEDEDPPPGEEELTALVADVDTDDVDTDDVDERDADDVAAAAATQNGGEL